jgi:hypothetical protein
MRLDHEVSVGPRAGAVALLAACALAAASCGKSQPAAPSAPSKDFKAAAKTSIDEKNMDAEMKKLKSEIDSDSK